MSLHTVIVNTLRTAYKVQPLVGFEILADDDDNFVKRHLFQNYRTADGDESGLRLTPAGHLILSKYFKLWRIRLTCRAMSSRHYLYLDRVCNMPWYIEVAENLPDGSLIVLLTLMEADLAMKAKLIGDLDILRTAFE